ncbi:NAD(P)H-dependent flavin oxidoreductase [Actinoplanes friuliensis]|uniref:Propionate 3-nitronate monooxygenase n=1 Tax=Actinoplanes friuliensis DSM 7358 TaxID=1246995 RepID=U5W344_9ACTN|nr:nitronate monooxygenase [Actinoplanes friuliensis]AGZ42351.1 putative dioxygenase [Actinoplanes friuliensis DSM 7358]
MLPDLARPVLVAPMAGGPSTTALVRAAADAGATGFLAAGYKTPEVVEAEVGTLRAAGVPYGLNIFVPMPRLDDPAPIERYRRELQPEADRYGVELPAIRGADDDHFAAKVEIAVSAAVPLVSFTFGVPDRGVVRALRDAGSTVLITVTGVDEARRALAAGPDLLIAQAGTAGGHAATTDPREYRGTSVATGLLPEILAVSGVPVVAAGGTGTAADVRALLTAGAIAVQAGTAFLLADEAGTRAPQREAMLSGRHTATVVTRAFTGQPARALRNRFTDTYSASAPVGYPAIHHLTAPIRAAAAARGDAEALNLWAGTAFAAAAPGPAAHLLDRLCA